MLQLIQIELHGHESMNQVAHLRTVQYFSDTYETFYFIYIKIKNKSFNAAYSRHTAAHLSNLISLIWRKNTNLVLIYNNISSRKRWLLICTYIHNIKLYVNFLIYTKKKKRFPKNGNLLETTWNRDFCSFHGVSISGKTPMWFGFH